MNKLTAFVRLDFITVKPYFTVKTLGIYALVAILLTTSTSAASGISAGMMFATLFVGYPFALGEKGMDALYATLAISRKTVVLGRYIFTLLVNAGAILLSVGLGTAGKFALNTRGGTSGAGDTTGIVLALSAIFLIIQFIQLPMYFKVGYTKAKFLTFIPFGAMFAGSFIISAASNSGGPPEFLARALTGGMIVPLLVAALLAVAFISYRLSLAFYKKREF